MKNIVPLVHNRLSHEKEVKPIDGEDKLCLKEIAEVLKKHNRLDRFGITLLHKHFELEDDEILIEETDETNRIQTIRPYKNSVVEKIGGEILETAWSL